MPLYEAPDRIEASTVQLINRGDGLFEVVDPGLQDAFSIFHYFEGTATTAAGLDVFSTGDFNASIDARYDVAAAGRFSTWQSTAGPSQVEAIMQTYIAGGTGAFMTASPIDFVSTAASGVKTNLRWEMYIANPVVTAFIGLDNAGIFCGGKNTKWQFQTIAADAVTNIGYEFDTLNPMSTAGMKHSSWKVNTAEIMSLSYNGLLALASGNFATPVTVDLAANSAGVATTFVRSDHKHTLSQSIAPTWSATHTFTGGASFTTTTVTSTATWTVSAGVWTFTAQPVFNGGISLGTSGQIASIEPDAAISSTASAFYLIDNTTRTQLQSEFKVRSSVASVDYINQFSTGEISFGYDAQPQQGFILGFLGSTENHPSYTTTLLSKGILAYVRHRDVTLTPDEVSGVAGLGFCDATSATVPSSVMPYFGVLGAAGGVQDSASYTGKKLASIRGLFTGTGQNAETRGTTIDNSANSAGVYGNYDSAFTFFSDCRGYMFVKGSNNNPTNKPALVASFRVPIQGMGATTQAGILGFNRIITRSTATGHVNEDINNCTNSFFASIPFPSATATGARTTLRTTNAAHLAVEAYPAATNGPTWATFTNPEDTETNNYYGLYLDKGTNNPFGWYQHDGTSWQRMLSVVAMGRFTAQTAAKATVVAYTAPADGSYEISMNVLVTTSTVHTFTCECAYTDEGNTARVLTMNFSSLAGAFVTAIANAAGAVPYEGVPLHIRVKSGSTITLRTQAAGTYTTVTYNVEGKIVALT